VNEIVGFWVRRMGDGTWKYVLNILGNLFKRYDPVFYRRYYRSGGRIWSERLRQYPDVLLKNIKESSLKSILGGYNNKKVVILKRKIRGLQFEYLIQAGSIKKWVSKYYIKFIRRCGPALVKN